MQPVVTNKLKTTSAYTGPNKTRKYKYNGKWVVDHHYGIDLVGGTQIVATADGKVVKVVNKGENNGTMCKVRIQHKTYQSAYYHLKSGSIVVKEGEYVKKGQYLAEMGNTGHSTGKHLHFQIDKGGNSSSIDPTDYAYGRKELVGLPAPTPITWEPGDYITLQHKYIRCTPEVLTTNKVKYSRLSAEAKPKCISDNKGYAKYKIGVTVTIREFATDSKGNVWGKTKNTWLCVEDSSGAQVKKKN